jgi:HK97 family phage major capsid protein
MSAALTTGQKVILYGAMEKFIIRDAGPIRFYRLEELYRDLDCTGFVAFTRMDSHVINSAAIKLGTMG